MAIVTLAEERSKNNLPNAYSSWLQYWEARKNRDADTCSITMCINPAEVGVGVVLAGSDEDSLTYIVPLCKRCRSKAMQLRIPFRVHRKKLAQAPRVK